MRQHPLWNLPHPEAGPSAPLWNLPHPVAGPLAFAIDIPNMFWKKAADSVIKRRHTGLGHEVPEFDLALLATRKKLQLIGLRVECHNGHLLNTKK